MHGWGELRALYRGPLQRPAEVGGTKGRKEVGGTKARGTKVRQTALIDRIL